MDHDLRHDPDELPVRGYSVVDEWALRQERARRAANPDAHALRQERAHYDLPTVTQPAQVLTPAQLRTVPMPNLRSPDARTLDAEARGLYDTRTEQEKITAELVRLVDVWQALTLRHDLLEEFVRTHCDSEAEAALTPHNPLEQSDVWEVVALARRINTLEAVTSEQAARLARLEAGTHE